MDRGTTSRSASPHRHTLTKNSVLLRCNRRAVGSLLGFPFGASLQDVFAAFRRLLTPAEGSLGLSNGYWFLSLRYEHYRGCFPQCQQVAGSTIRSRIPFSSSSVIFAFLFRNDKNEKFARFSKDCY